MVYKEREELIRIIQNHSGNKSGTNFTALSDAELRQQAQRMVSSATLKKAAIPAKAIMQKKKQAEKKKKPGLGKR